MTDICTKSLKLIKSNIDLNKDCQNASKISVNYLEWGVFDKNKDLEEFYEDKNFPKQFKNAFDLIIASDVVYLPECIDPLLKSFKHFMKEDKGQVLMMNNKIRQDLFEGTFDQVIKDNELQVERLDNYIMDSTSFKLYVLKHHQQLL